MAILKLSFDENNNVISSIPELAYDETLVKDALEYWIEFIKLYIKQKNKLDKSIILVLDEEKFNAFITEYLEYMNSQFKQIDNFIDWLLLNTTKQYTKDEYKVYKDELKAQAEKEKLEKQKAKELKEINQSFIKFFKTIATEKTSLTSQSNIITLRDESFDLFGTFTMEFTNDKVIINYLKSDYTVIRSEINNSYIEASCPTFYKCIRDAKYISNNIKIKINSVDINLLRKCKTNDFASTEYMNDHILVKAFVNNEVNEAVFREFKFDFVDKSFGIIESNNNQDYIECPNLDLLDDMSNDELFLDIGTNRISIPSYAIKISLKSEHKSYYKITNNNLIELTMVDNDFKISQYFRAALY